MSEPRKGENCILYVNGEYITCWRSMQFSVDVETVGKSTIGSGNNREFEPVSIGWTGSGEGQVFNDTGLFTVHNLFDLQQALANVFLIWEVDGGSGNMQYYYGEAIITNLTQVYNVNDIASFNAEFQGTGAIGRDTENGIYGAPPTGFEIDSVTPDTPGVGEVTIAFTWTAADPEPQNYQIDRHDVTIDEHYYENGGYPGNTMSIGMGDTHTYTFRIRSVYSDYGAYSEWSSPVITWP